MHAQARRMKPRLSSIGYPLAHLSVLVVSLCIIAMGDRGMPCPRGRGLPASRLCCNPSFRAGNQQWEGQSSCQPRLDWPGACDSLTLSMPPPAHARRVGRSDTCLPPCASRSGCTAILNCTAQSGISIMVPTARRAWPMRKSPMAMAARGREVWRAIPFASCVRTRYRTSGSARLSRGCFPS